MTAALAPRAAAQAGVLDIDARLAAVDAAMTVRLEEAALGWEVNTAHLPVDTAPVVEHLPVDTKPADDTNPVAALLRRARQRILRDGWAQGAARTGTSDMCLLEALHAEARSHREEGEARLLVRRALGGGDPIPELNRRLSSTAQAAQVLATAADMADSHT